MRTIPTAHQFANWLLDGLGAMLWACAIVMAMFAIYILSPFGARSRDAARDQMLTEIRMESQAFCEKFGMPVGTAQHLQCVLELDKIRANQDERTNGVWDLP